MKNLIKVLNEVCSDWETLGVKLDVKWSKIKEIAKSRSHREPHLCLADLMDFWLGNDVDASWERVATALEEMGKVDLARGIRRAHCSSGIHIFRRQVQFTTIFFCLCHCRDFGKMALCCGFFLGSTLQIITE